VWLIVADYRGSACDRRDHQLAELLLQVADEAIHARHGLLVMFVTLLFDPLVGPFAESAGGGAFAFGFLLGDAGVDAVGQQLFGAVAGPACFGERARWVRPERQHLLLAAEAVGHAPGLAAGGCDQKEQSAAVTLLVRLGLRLQISAGGFGQHWFPLRPPRYQQMYQQKVRLRSARRARTRTEPAQKPLFYKVISAFRSVR
jgi:hypothetical protein